MDAVPGGTAWDARSLPQRRNFIQAGDPADVAPHFAAILVDGTTHRQSDAGLTVRSTDNVVNKWTNETCEQCHTTAFVLRCGKKFDPFVMGSCVARLKKCPIFGVYTLGIYGIGAGGALWSALRAAGRRVFGIDDNVGLAGARRRRAQ
jgi:hypothetical protein